MNTPPLIIWNRLSLSLNPRLPVWLRDFGVDPDGELWVPTELLEESTGRRILERARRIGSRSWRTAGTSRTAGRSCRCRS